MTSNTFIFAAAGSGKTTTLVKKALQEPEENILITTYTTENIQNIKDIFIQINGFVPSNITIQAWYSFLLSDMVRPFQKNLYSSHKITEMELVAGISAKYTKATEIQKHYFNQHTQAIYSDKIAKFSYNSNSVGNNCYIKRLEKCYSKIFIDEAQDLSGYDFELIEFFLQSKLEIILVGDGRQSTYKTHHSPKHKNKTSLYQWFKEWEKKGWGNLVEQKASHRCSAEICKFADSFYPNLPATISKNIKKVEHLGLFYIRPQMMLTYYQRYHPLVLIYDKRSKDKAQGLPTINFGMAKGKTHDRVLIIPNKMIDNYLASNDKSKIMKSCAKLYVAITRARYSVTFVTDVQVNVPELKEYSFN